MLSLLSLRHVTFSSAEEPTVWYCNNQKFSNDIHPELRRYVPRMLEQLHRITPDNSTNSAIKYGVAYPAENPVLYASSFCKQSSSSECGHCLRVAKRKLLHQCVHAIGGQVYSELCFLRFELYDFFHT
ncbi:hypothetical protein LINGRAHAP2_LOCUS11826 [Linum grandiflorum]